MKINAFMIPVCILLMSTNICFAQEAEVTSGAQVTTEARAETAAEAATEARPETAAEAATEAKAETAAEAKTETAAEAATEAAAEAAGDPGQPAGEKSDQAEITPTVMPEEDMVVIPDFPVILQKPELPTGCEITALAMVLNYYGLPADKVELAKQYLPMQEMILYKGADGKKYGPDMNRYFIGDPFSNGLTCGTGAIMDAAGRYLHDQKSLHYAVDMTGSNVDALYNLVDQNCPVMIWITISMADRMEPEGWYTENGVYVDWSSNDHGAVLIGYSESKIMAADPLAGIVEYDKAQFEKIYEARGKRSMIIK